jgi:hypothetical protein
MQTQARGLVYYSLVINKGAVLMLMAYTVNYSQFLINTFSVTMFLKISLKSIGLQPPGMTAFSSFRFIYISVFQSKIFSI